MTAHGDGCACAACDAARLVRAELLPPPPGLDERVLARVQAERPVARAAPRHAGWRAWLSPRVAAPGFVAVLAASLAALAVWGPALWSLVAPERASAVPIAPLTATCPDASDDDVLEVAGVWDGEEAERFAEALRRFERESGVPVVYRYETREIAPKLRARITSECPPDVAVLPQPGLMADLARDGHIAPIDDVADDLVREQYGDTWRQLGEVDGQLYGVWFKASDKSTLWFRDEALAEAGLPGPPSTWDALLDHGERLAAAGVRPLAVAGADGWTLTDWFENLYLRTAGPVLYDRLTRHEIPWTHPTVRRVLRDLARVWGDPTLSGPSAEVLATSFESSVRQALGPRATAAMVYEADFVRSFLDGAEAQFADFPAAGAGVVVGGDVAVRFHAGDETAALIRFLATPAAAEGWARAGGFVSPNRGVPLDAYPDAATRSSALRLSHAETVRFDLSDLQPPAFGGTTDQGLWGLFRDLAVPGVDVGRVAWELEAAATAAAAGG